MEYTVQRLSKLAGVSPRTLRFYDQIGLLSPARTSASGYRIYGPAQVDALQQILLYREMGMGLQDIAKAMRTEEFDRLSALNAHLKALEARQAELRRLIDTVQKTIDKEMGKCTMTDAEKFEGFKEKLIQENEEKYGKEVREKYGEDAVNASNAKMMGLTKEQYDRMQKLSEDLHQKLEAAVGAGLSPDSETGRDIALLHKAWLGFTWAQYSPEAHRGLGDMYVADERFTAYYDQNVKGCAAFLRDAIHRWAE